MVRLRRKKIKRGLNFLTLVALKGRKVSYFISTQNLGGFGLFEKKSVNNGNCSGIKSVDDAFAVLDTSI